MDESSRPQEEKAGDEQMNPDEQFNLGLKYYRGEGVSQDHQEAAKWFRMAAEQGNANAQYSLGWAYQYGQGVPEVPE
jgi:TPR repeat protein